MIEQTNLALSEMLPAPHANCKDSGPVECSEEQLKSEQPVSTAQLLCCINNLSRGTVLQTATLPLVWHRLTRALSSTSAPDSADLASWQSELEAGGEAWIEALCTRWIDTASDAVKVEFARLAAIRLLGGVAGADPQLAELAFNRLWAVAADSRHTVDARAWALTAMQDCDLEITPALWQATFGATSDLEAGGASYWLETVPEAKVRARAVETIGRMARNAAQAFWQDGDQASVRSERLQKCRLAANLFEMPNAMLLAHWDREIDYSVTVELVKALGYTGGWCSAPSREQESWKIIDVFDAGGTWPDSRTRYYVPGSIERVAGSLVLRDDITAQQQTTAVARLIHLTINTIRLLQVKAPQGRFGDVYEQQRRYLLALRHVAEQALVGLRRGEPETIVGLVVSGLLEVADGTGFFESQRLRRGALHYLNVLAKHEPRGRTLVGNSVRDAYSCMLADPDRVVADIAAHNLVTVMGEREASAFFLKIILDDDSPALDDALRHRHEHWADASLDADSMRREVRQLAARALGGIKDNGEAHDRLVKTLRRDGSRSSRARDALITMGGERAVESIVHHNLQQQVNDKFFEPLHQASERGWNLLEDVRGWSRANHKLSLYAALATMGAGVALLVTVVWAHLLPFVEPLDPAVLLGGSILTLLGAAGAYLWEPVKGLNKVAAELSRLIMSFENYLGRMRLIGLGFAHAYTQNSFDQLQFLSRISEISAQAMRESALSLESIGAWPDFELAREERFVVVPALIGSSLYDARQLAQQTALAVAIADAEYRPDVPPGAIVAQEPAPGLYVSRGAKIKVTPATDQRPAVVVPDLAGIGLVDMLKETQKSRLELRTIILKAHDEIPEGTIIAQELRPGLQVTEGTAITVTVSKGADRAPAPPPQQPAEAAQAAG